MQNFIHNTNHVKHAVLRVYNKVYRKVARNQCVHSTVAYWSNIRRVDGNIPTTVHCLGLLAPAGDMDPGSQGVQVVEPGFVLYVLLGHSLHVPSVLYQPALQFAGMINHESITGQLVLLQVVFMSVQCTYLKYWMANNAPPDGLKPTSDVEQFSECNGFSCAAFLLHR